MATDFDPNAPPRRASVFYPTIPKENSTEVWLDLQGPAPAPCRDYHQLIVKAKNQIVWWIWKINNANKHGLGPTPVSVEYTHSQYKDEDQLQEEIGRVFGPETVEYIADLLTGKIDYLQRLPANILLNIAQYLYLEDLYNSSLSSCHLGEFWNSPELWEYFYKKYTSEPVTNATLESAKKIGWKDMFISNGYCPKLRQLETRSALVSSAGKADARKKLKGSTKGSGKIICSAGKYYYLIIPKRLSMENLNTPSQSASRESHSSPFVSPFTDSVASALPNSNTDAETKPPERQFSTTPDSNLGFSGKSALDFIPEWQVRLGLTKRLEDERTFETKLERSASLEFRGRYLLDQIDDLLHQHPIQKKRQRIPSTLIGLENPPERRKPRKIGILEEYMETQMNERHRLPSTPSTLAEADDSSTSVADVQAAQKEPGSRTRTASKKPVTFPLRYPTLHLLEKRRLRRKIREPTSPTLVEISEDQESDSAGLTDPDGFRMTSVLFGGRDGSTSSHSDQPDWGSMPLIFNQGSLTLDPKFSHAHSKLSDDAPDHRMKELNRRIGIFVLGAFKEQTEDIAALIDDKILSYQTIVEKLLQAKKYRSVILLYRRMAYLWPLTSHDLYLLAQCYFAVRDFEKAFLFYSDSIVMSSYRKDYRQKCADSWFRMAKTKHSVAFETAVRLYRQIISEFPNNLDYRLSLMDCYVKQKQNRQAIDLIYETIHGILRKTPKAAKTKTLVSAFHLQMAVLAKEIDDLATTYRCLEKSLFYEPTNTKAESMLADLRRITKRQYYGEACRLLTLRNYEGAMDRVEQALLHCPGNRPYLLLKGAILRKQKNFQSAFDHFLMLADCQLPCDHTENWKTEILDQVLLLLNDWAVYEYSCGRLKQSEIFLRTAVEMDTRRCVSTLYLNSGIVSQKLCSWSRAKECFTAAEQILQREIRAAKTFRVSEEMRLVRNGSNQVNTYLEQSHLDQQQWRRKQLRMK